MRNHGDSSEPALTVGLFVTCLVDTFRPSIGMAAVELLEAHGCRVVVPPTQTCCGQPAYNSGDEATARDLALQVIDAFEAVDYIVVPSGSCAGMLKLHYPGLFAADTAEHRRCIEVVARVYELTSFLVDVLHSDRDFAAFDGKLSYHDSCSGLRELGISRQPRQLLSRSAGVQLKELPDSEVCCGFGGTFCVKYPLISSKLVSDKVANLVAADADVLVGGDLGCLLNLAGRLKRLGRPEKVYHVAEILAGCESAAAIGESPTE